MQLRYLEVDGEKRLQYDMCDVPNRKPGIWLDVPTVKEDKTGLQKDLDDAWKAGCNCRNKSLEDELFNAWRSSVSGPDYGWKAVVDKARELLT